MICPNCATENDADARFCTECGTTMQAGCPNCGFVNRAGAKFCRDCGTTLTAGAALTGGTATAIGGASATTSGAIPVGPQVVGAGSAAERRLVSVLFADLVGFTPFAEERDAEQVRDTLSRYFELASDVITRYGGTVEKFIGDAVMAVWGAPVAHEDDAERAVRAALELVDAVRGLGSGIDARAAVLTGEAAVTVGATNQGMVAGDLVNTASRLQSVAAPGTVLVGEATHHAASQSIAFEEAGEQALKGKTAPVPAWRAVRVVAELGGRNRSDTLEAPFVGRDEEFRLLKDLFHQTGREKRARLVSLIGPAGIGKSRLAWEFSKYTDGLIETTYWHIGRSPSYGDGITFWALGEMVRRRVGLTEGADEKTTRAKVAEALGRWIPDEAERRWIEPALLTLLGVERGGGSEQLFAAWRTFFERIAADGTVTMVFEDLHWADPGTLDFIDHLLDWSKNVPIYVVTLARPELLEKRPDWGAGKRNFVSLSLEPLPEAAMIQLLTGLVPGLPDKAVRDIVVRADGIPLYAVETVRMLVADGSLRLDGDAYVPIGDLSDLAVPDTLTALIAARLDALEPTDRKLLQDAAVLGQSFTPLGLAAVSGLPAGDLEARLRALVRRELLELQADPRSPDRGQYKFVQALIREVAYNTLARKERKARHLAAARFFESLGSDELAGALASQYLAAHGYATEGPEADALAGQARIALRAAATRAASLGAHQQASRFYEEAIKVTPDAVEQAELHEQAGDEAVVANRHEAAERHFRAAIELNRAVGDRPATARAVAALGRELITSRQTEQALAVLEAASAEFADLADHEAGARLGAQVARGVYLNGDVARAAQLIDPVLATAERLDLKTVVADALVTRGSALAQLGRMAEGLALLRAGQELAERIGDAEAITRAIGNRIGYEADADPRAALEIGRAGLATMERLGVRWPVVVGNVIWSAMRVGEWPYAMDLLDSTLAWELEPSDRTDLLPQAIWMRSQMGEPFAEFWTELNELTGDATDLYLRLSRNWGQVGVDMAAGRFKEARIGQLKQVEEMVTGPSLAFAGRFATFDRSLEHALADLAAFDAAGMHSPLFEADRLTMQAGVAALHGRTREAVTLYRSAIDAWRDLGTAWDEALCELQMVRTLDPEQPEVATAAESARVILTRLGARTWLRFLDEWTAPAATVPQEEATNAVGERVTAA